VTVSLVLQQFFPENMVETKMSSKDDTNGLLTHSERYKNLLLQVIIYSWFDFTNTQHHIDTVSCFVFVVTSFRRLNTSKV